VSLPRYTVFAAYDRERGLIPATVLLGDFVTDPVLSRLVVCRAPFRWVQVVQTKYPETAEEVAAHTFSEGVAGDLVPLDPGAGGLARVSIRVNVASRPHPWEPPAGQRRR
jgi:hypothetical protein